MVSYLKRWGVSALILLFYSAVVFGEAPIEYEKVDHPPKLEGVLARIQKNWVAQKNGRWPRRRRDNMVQQLLMAKISLLY